MDRTDEPVVYSYDDYIDYLRDLIEARPRLSQAAFARRAGMSPAQLSLAMSRQRQLGAGQLPGLRRARRISDVGPEERAFFALLFRRARAKVAEVRDALTEELQALRTIQMADPLEAPHVSLMANWWWQALYELPRCSGFRPDPEWIAAQLTPSDVAPEDVTEALEAMVALGLLARTEDRSYTATTDSVRCGPVRVSGQLKSSAIRHHNYWSLRRAATVLDAVPRREQMFSNITLALPSDQVDAVGVMAHRFFGRVADRMGRRGPLDQVFQANFQLFPVTAPISRG